MDTLIEAKNHQSNKDDQFEDESSTQQQPPLNFNSLLDLSEDIDDILEYCNEIFEIDNQVTRKLLTNSLLHYFYLPVIVGSLSGRIKEL